jgi:3-hydroxybutyryl-CoA dehydrogenase
MGKGPERARPRGELQKGAPETRTRGKRGGKMGPRSTAVIGAGTMGHGLALLVAKAGYKVSLVDLEEGILEGAMALIEAEARWLEDMGELREGGSDLLLQRIDPTVDLEKAVTGSELVLEAIVEDKEAKAALYARIAPWLGKDGILCSNTSYLDVFQLAPRELLPRFLIAHFYAPPHLIPLVEVVASEKVASHTKEKVVGFLSSLGQRPVVMERFIPGYIVNRLQRAMAREIFHLLEGGYATAEQIDEAVKASLGIRIPILGVVQRYDFTGLDLALKFLENPSIELVSEDKIPEILREKVASGHLGVKTGKGFYDYGGKPLEEILLERDRKLLELRRFLEGR